MNEQENRKSTQRSTQVQAARRLTALLLHVWIDVIMMASYKWCFLVRNPEGWQREVGEEQILPWEITSLSYLEP